MLIFASRWQNSRSLLILKGIATVRGPLAADLIWQICRDQIMSLLFYKQHLAASLHFLFVSCCVCWKKTCVLWWRARKERTFSPSGKWVCSQWLGTKLSLLSLRVRTRVCACVCARERVNRCLGVCPAVLGQSCHVSGPTDGSQVAQRL